MAPACIAAFRTKSSSFAVLMMTRVLGETARSSFWTSRPLIPDMKISRTARATVLQITYVRKASGSLNNFACKPTDESKRLSALSIDGSSSTTQITPATTGKAADKIMFIFLRVKRHRERRLKLATLPGTESRRSTRNRASLRLGAQSDQFSFGVHVGRGAKMIRASRDKDSRSDRACILHLSSIRRGRCDPYRLRDDHELCRSDPVFQKFPICGSRTKRNCADIHRRLWIKGAYSDVPKVGREMVISN